MKTKDLIKLDQQYIMPTYGGKNIAFSRGKGCKLWDVEGKEYLDFLGGIAVNGLGHAHPELVKAIREQAESLVHTSNLYLIPNQIELAKLLIENTFPGKCFFCNSGAEANEAAIKFARKYGRGRFEIITMQGSFHGRTYGALTATGQQKYHKGFEPMLAGFKYAQFNNLNSVEELITSQTCAVMVEVLQGEGGVHPAEEDFVQGLRQLCKQKDLLLIIDEVQSGMGRTGRFFAYQHYNITPDVVTVAKSLGGGVPIGAAIFGEEIAATFQPGDHAATFGGNPLATKAAVTTIQVIIRDQLVQNAQKMGEYFLSKLLTLKEAYPFVEEIRGKGLMLGVEVDLVAKEILAACLKKGLIIGTAGEKILRFLPPLIVSKEEIDEAMEVLRTVFEGQEFE